MVEFHRQSYTSLIGPEIEYTMVRSESNLERERNSENGGNQPRHAKTMRVIGGDAETEVHTGILTDHR